MNTRQIIIDNFYQRAVEEINTMAVGDTFYLNELNIFKEIPNHYEDDRPNLYKGQIGKKIAQQHSKLGLKLVKIEPCKYEVL
ncbi:hypothetical protein [Terrisporobacter petrolearius]|uniref:hypothetical protein n=1 Tax=Terrisporobacter petrolearius TaxID=1460447 RepID=UPI0022E72117|nr:hypothetical protein [Terrisporobacter petrolearius]